MKKRIAILLAALLLVGLLPYTAVSVSSDEKTNPFVATAYADVQHYGGNHPICGNECSHSEKHDNIIWQPYSNGFTSGTDKKPNYYYLTGNLVVSGGWNFTLNYIVICLNGFNITGTGGQLINITSGRNLTITDCKPAGQQGKIAHDDGAAGRGVYVQGVFNMYGGNIIGNTFSGNNGGGVHVGTKTGLRAVFNMSGGTISGNTVKMDNGSGGKGGGVYMGSGSTFTMSGTAEVVGNAAAYGGGVYMKGGTFDLKGGSIMSNNGSSNSGGVFVNAKETAFKVSGSPVVSNNTSSGANNVKLDDDVINGEYAHVNVTGNLVGDAYIEINYPTSGLESRIRTVAGAAYKLDGNVLKAGDGTPAAKTLSNIAITTPPAKTTYTAGESFDPAGMVVTATYSDNTTAVVTNYTVTDGSNLAEGKTAVTISYTEGGVTKTATQAITVSPASGGTEQDAVEAPVFSPAGGTYTAAQSVTLTCATEGAKIYYTTDGAVPTTASTEYADAITVSETMTIKAIAVKEGMNDSAVTSAAYTINSSSGGDPTPVTPSAGGYYYAGPTVTAVLNGLDAKSATDYSGGIYGLIFRSTAVFSGFQGVQVDGKTIAAANYTAEDNGGIEVYLKAVYLQTLAAGKHTLTILSAAGDVTVEFTVNGGNSSPKTFDAGIGVYAVSAVLSLAGMAWVGKKKF